MSIVDLVGQRRQRREDLQRAQNQVSNLSNFRASLPNNRQNAAANGNKAAAANGNKYVHPSSHEMQNFALKRTRENLLQAERELRAEKARGAALEQDIDILSTAFVQLEAKLAAAERRIEDILADRMLMDAANCISNGAAGRSFPTMPPVTRRTSKKTHVPTLSELLNMEP